MQYQSTVLDNGVTVVTESMPDVRSITLGMWFNVGSRDETQDQAGLTHFMEHMMFKGTPTRCAQDISMSFDELGADLNAFTSKEYTCYYARFVDEKLPKALPILADMVVNSQFSQETIDPERQVVLEEIARSEDAPDDYVYEVSSSAMLPDHPLGLPVLGTRESVGGFTHDDCVRFHEQHYYSGNLTVVAAGNVDHQTLVNLVSEQLADMPQGPKALRSFKEPGSRKLFSAYKRETEQAHIVFGYPWIKASDDDRYTAALLNAMLGGSMSSRLFLEVREKRGLVYAVYSNSQNYQDQGIFSIYAGTRPDNAKQVTEIISKEVQKFVEEGPTQAELDRNRELTCGHLLLGLESTSSRMIRLGRALTMGLEVNDIDTILSRYKQVTIDDVVRVARTYLTADPTIALVSPLESDEAAKLLGIAK